MYPVIPALTPISSSLIIWSFCQQLPPPTNLEAYKTELTQAMQFPPSSVLKRGAWKLSFS
jgi:hypothetical protein